MSKKYKKEKSVLESPTGKKFRFRPRLHTSIAWSIAPPIFFPVANTSLNEYTNKNPEHTSTVKTRPIGGR